MMGVVVLQVAQGDLDQLLLASPIAEKNPTRSHRRSNSADAP